MHAGRVLLQVVGKAVQFEGGAAADDEVASEQGLQGDDDLLPAERAARALIDAARRLLQPACCHVLAAQSGRIAVPGQPRGIDQQPFRQQVFELV